MISRLRGTLLTRKEERVEVATSGGVVYQVEIPLSVVRRLPRVGEEVEILTLQVVREDLIALYGFLEDGERALFEQLIGASGVGPRLGLAMLSTYPAARLARALAEKDFAALVQIPGVGRKKAERLVLELADRVAEVELGGPSSAGEASSGEAHAAVRALVALGMAFADADRAVREGLDEGTTGTDELVRKALARSVS